MHLFERVPGGRFQAPVNVTSLDDPAVPDDTPLAGRFDPDDLLTGGAGLEVRGSLARGFLVQGAATGGVDPTPDVKDVTQNFNPILNVSPC